MFLYKIAPHPGGVFFWQKSATSWGEVIFSHIMGGELFFRLILDFLGHLKGDPGGATTSCGVMYVFGTSWVVGGYFSHILGSGGANCL